VAEKVRERLAVSKRTTHRVHMERFNLKKLNEVEGKEQYSQQDDAAKRLIIRKHATRQHNLPDIAKTSCCRSISKVPKLFEQTMYYESLPSNGCIVTISLRGKQSVNLSWILIAFMYSLK
jgi:hypothetical protein